MNCKKLEEMYKLSCEKPITCPPESNNRLCPIVKEMRERNCLEIMKFYNTPCKNGGEGTDSTTVAATSVKSDIIMYDEK